MKKPYQISTQKTSIAYVVGTFFIVLILMSGQTVLASLSESSRNEGAVLFLAVLLATVGIMTAVIVQDVIRSRRIKKREVRMMELHALGGMKQSSGMFLHCSLNELDKSKIVRNRRYEHFVEVGKYTYADYAYEIYQRSKHGEYHTATHYYSVIAAKLPRKLPHVLFDSLKSRKRQFRFMFAGNQLHNLEGDFNQHFAVYFPYEYHIDSLSFLAPDVLWAIRAADEYDIEIVGDAIYLFGSQSDPDTQIKEMSEKLDEIMRALGRSLEIYRDERLPYADGRSSVTPLGATLARNLTLDYIKCTLGLLSIAIVVVAAATGFTYQRIGNVIFYVLFFGLAAFWKSVRNIRQEKARRKVVLDQMALLKQASVVKP